jgi:hypothetical protein
MVLLAHSPEISDPTLAYKQRWAIETGFRSMKSGGFNMQHTHLTKPKRVTNLFRIISLVTAIFMKLGVELAKERPIKIKKHGRKAISFLRLAIASFISLKHKILSQLQQIIWPCFNPLNLPSSDNV